MSKQDVAFQSNGATCRGFFQTPDDVEPPYPTVVLGGGWCYVKEVVLPHYADRFVEEGLACLAFDYRNLGESDVVDQEQHLDPQKQIEDYRSAITYVEARDDVAEYQIGVFGISYSGGHGLILSATEPRVKCVVATVPVIEGWENMQRAHGEDHFYQLLDALEEDRRQRIDGTSGMIPHSRKPGADWDEGPVANGAWPWSDVYETFEDIKQNEAPNYRHWSTLHSVDLLLDYDVMPFVRRNNDTPTKVIATKNDEKCLWDRQVDAYNELKTDRKELTVVPDATHMTIYSDRGLLAIAADEGAAWYHEHLIDPYE